jgi:hypothetical protein
MIDRQNQFGWGKNIVESLAQELQKDFVGVNGFYA